MKKYYGAPVGASAETLLGDIRAELARIILAGDLKPEWLDVANRAATRPDVLRDFFGLEPRAAALAAMERLAFR